MLGHPHFLRAIIWRKNVSHDSEHKVQTSLEEEEEEKEEEGEGEEEEGTCTGSKFQLLLVKLTLGRRMKVS